MLEHQDSGWLSSWYQVGAGRKFTYSSLNEEIIIAKALFSITAMMPYTRALLAAR